MDMKEYGSNLRKAMKAMSKRLAAICLALAMSLPVIAHATEPTAAFRETAQDFRENPHLTVRAVKTKLKLNRTSASILIDEKITLKATVTGKKGTVKWSSSKKSVVTVSSKGVVTGKKKGTATITAKVNGVKKTCKVTVKSIPNVDNSMLKLSARKAAQKTGFGYRISYGHNGYLCLYSRKPIKNHRKVKESRIYSDRRYETINGAWELSINDKTVTFMGVKTGMTKKQALKAMSNSSWKKKKEKKDGSITEILFSPPKKATYARKYAGEAIITIESGKVTKVDYEIDHYRVPY